MEQDITIYLTKAEESLRTAESEFANGRYNSCANRCYYACFQAAIAALLAEGIRARGQWSHEFVQGQFVGMLINQRHLYDTQLRRVLSDNQNVREKADYRPELVNATGHPFNAGHPAPSMTCREGLTTLPWHGQLVDL